MGALRRQPLRAQGGAEALPPGHCSSGQANLGRRRSGRLPGRRDRDWGVMVVAGDAGFQVEGRGWKVRAGASGVREGIQGLGRSPWGFVALLMFLIYARTFLQYLHMHKRMNCQQGYTAFGKGKAERRLTQRRAKCGPDVNTSRGRVCRNHRDSRTLRLVCVCVGGADPPQVLQGQSGASPLPQVPQSPPRAGKNVSRWKS